MKTQEQIQANRARAAKWQRDNRDKANARKIKWAKENPEKRKLAQQKYEKDNPGKKTAWRIENREKDRAQKRAWDKANPDKKKAYSKKWYDKNLERERAVNKLWKKNNTGKVNSYTAKRRAQKLKATPSWLTDSHYKEMQEFYDLAKELRWLSDDPLHVDHIVPLLGENVSGLHVPWNLQILPRSKNCSKSNRIKEML